MVFAAGVLEWFQVNSYLFVQDHFGREFGRFRAEIHYTHFWMFGFGCVHPPQSHASVRFVVMWIGNVQIDSIAVNDLYDFEGFFVVELLVAAGWCFEKTHSLRQEQGQKNRQEAESDLLSASPGER